MGIIILEGKGGLGDVWVPVLPLPEEGRGGGELKHTFTTITTT